MNKGSSPAHSSSVGPNNAAMELILDEAWEKLWGEAASGDSSAGPLPFQVNVK